MNPIVNSSQVCCHYLFKINLKFSHIWRTFFYHKNNHSTFHCQEVEYNLHYCYHYFSDLIWPSFQIPVCRYFRSIGNCLPMRHPYHLSRLIHTQKNMWLKIDYKHKFKWNTVKTKLFYSRVLTTLKAQIIYYLNTYKTPRNFRPK